MKLLGINLAKDQQDLYTRNMQTLLSRVAEPTQQRFPLTLRRTAPAWLGNMSTLCVITDSAGPQQAPYRKRQAGC